MPIVSQLAKQAIIYLEKRPEKIGCCIQDLVGSSSKSEINFRIFNSESGLRLSKVLKQRNGNCTNSVYDKDGVLIKFTRYTDRGRYSVDFGKNITQSVVKGNDGQRLIKTLTNSDSFLSYSYTNALFPWDCNLNIMPNSDQNMLKEVFSKLRSYVVSGARPEFLD